MSIDSSMMLEQELESPSEMQKGLVGGLFNEYLSSSSKIALSIEKSEN